MKDDMSIIDVSYENNDNNGKDKFMIGIYISVIILVLLGVMTYFFGYELLKPFIKV